MVNKKSVEASENISYLRFMRKFAIILMILIPLGSFSQKEAKLKKKFFSHYKGIIPPYQMDIGDSTIQVSSASIYVEITKDSLFVNIGNNKLRGTYYVMFAAKTYYLLEANIDGQLATERIMVYKRGRHISRDGMYPQPVAELKRYKVR